MFLDVYDNVSYLKKLPILVPGIEYPFSLHVQSISNQLISDNIKVKKKYILERILEINFPNNVLKISKVLLCKKNCNIPIITAAIAMPVSESDI